MAAPGVFSGLDQSQFLGNLPEVRQFGAVDIEFATHRVHVRGPRIFGQGAQRCTRQPHAPAPGMHFQCRYHAQSVCIAFVGLDVLPLGRSQRSKKPAMGRVTEPAAHGIFAGVAERRVANVVCQAGDLDDRADIKRGAATGQTAMCHQPGTNLVAKTAPDRCHLDAVGQAIVGVVVLGQRVNLGLASQSPECTGKNHAVMVDVEFAAQGIVRCQLGTAGITDHSVIQLQAAAREE